MAAPNIVSPTTITLKGISSTVGTSSMTVLACPSNKAIKVSALVAANITATATAVVVDISDGTNSRSLVSNIAVPANASLLCITRDNPVYLEEGNSLKITAGATGAIHFTGSYEEIA
jgi:hypothetical protein